MLMELTLPRPHPAQQEIIDCPARFIVLRCGRRFGKSLICQNISILNMAGQKRVAYITPTYKLATVFFDEIVGVVGKASRTNRAELTIKLGMGQIRFFTGENIDALRGLKFHVVIIDEACYIKNLKDGWEQSIRATLTDYQGRAYFVSTPRGMDYFHSLTMTVDPNWKTFKFTTYDNPYIPVGEIDEARRMLPAPVFEQEYMANPMQNADNPFGSDNIRACIKPMSQDKPYHYGIDLAKSFDFTVIHGLDKKGNTALFNRFQKSWTHTKEEILKLPVQSNGYIDSTGVGDPILEEIQLKIPTLQGFKFTSNSKQQLMEGLVSAVHQGLIGFPQGIITDEMEVFEYRFTPTGVRYQAREGFHDDTVIALALAWKSFVENRNVGTYRIR